MKWDKDFIWRAYEMARDGKHDQDIAKTIGCLKKTFLRWKKKFPAFRNAVDRGRAMYVKPLKKANKNTDLHNFIYGKLPEHLKDTWDYIMLAYGDKNIIDINQMDEDVKGESREARQVLYLHAWYRCNFSVIEARRIINVAQDEWEDWQTDPVFLELFAKMDEIKSDFFESSMVNLVKKGHPAATVAANEAFNSNAYGRRTKVEVEGEVIHRHLHLVAMQDIEKYLDLDTKKKVLTAMRQVQAIEAGESIEVEEV